MKKIKNYFNLSTRENRATNIILIFLALLCCIRLLLPYLDYNTTVDFTLFKKEIEDFEKSEIYDTLSYDNNYVSNFSKDDKPYYSEVQLFAFDPNTIDSSSFLQLGLSPKQTKIVCNFRRKGGRFYNKESFKKIYGINPKLFQSLEPYITIADNKMDIPKNEKLPTNDSSSKFKQTFTKSNQEDLIIEINDADTTQLKKLPSIGSTFAKRLVAYRDRLGGYINKRQFYEVYGVDTILFQILDKHLVVDTNNIKKTNINTASIYTLKNFPYLKFSQATGLIRYRDNHGSFGKISDLKKCILIDELTYKKMRSYFKTND